jgi:hypothetical protein
MSRSAWAAASPLTRPLSWRARSWSADSPVQVLMTSAAEEFIAPLTFAALTGRKVITNLFFFGQR